MLARRLGGRRRRKPAGSARPALPGLCARCLSRLGQSGPPRPPVLFHSPLRVRGRGPLLRRFARPSLRLAAFKPESHAAPPAPPRPPWHSPCAPRRRGRRLCEKTPWRPGLSPTRVPATGDSHTLQVVATKTAGKEERKSCDLLLLREAQASSRNLLCPFLPKRRRHWWSPLRSARCPSLRPDSPHLRSCEPSPACTWPTPGPHLARKAKQAAPAQMGSEGKLLPTGRRGRVSVLPPGESAKAGQGAPCWPDCVTFMR